MIWKCKDKKIEYGSRTLLMGIVNVTPDSFSDGGEHYRKEDAVSHALRLAEEGAHLLDFGAQSTRPGYAEISAKEEWARLEGVISAVREKTALPLSADTYYPAVAEKALSEGADIINDISGKINPAMAALIRESGAGWIITHNGGGSVEEIHAFFEQAITDCKKHGIKTAQLCLDPGIGFGKSYEENLAIIANVRALKISGVPLLLGFSRKRVIGTASGQNQPAERVYGNIAADTAAILGGADLLRLHDITHEIQGIRTAQELKKWIR